MPRDRNDEPSSKKTNARGLVRKLLDNPRLPAYIANLETPVLDKLIRHVGIEDAQELIALATPAQMRELVEIDTWSNERPGAQESFDPKKLLAWVEIWNEMGANVLAQKLVEVGDELLTLALLDIVVVINMDEVAPGQGYVGAEDFDVFDRVQAPEEFDTYDKYAVFAKREDDWPAVRQILKVLWTEDPDLLVLVLGRCRFDRSVLAQDVSEKDVARVMHEDLAHAREQGREAKGYVTPLNATLFLAGAKDDVIDNLLIEVGYDAQTRYQLAQLAAARSPQKNDAGGDDSGTTGPAGVDRPAPVRDKDWLALDNLLERERIVQVAPPERMLAGPDVAGELYLKRMLKQLAQRDPQAMRQRLDEVVYLANVLISGSSLQGGVFNETEAAKAVYATCNLGLEYCLLEDPWDDEPEMLEAFLETEPGLIKAFRIGYHLIGQLPHKAVVALVRELTSVGVQRQLRHHPWVQEQIANAFGRVDIQGGLDDETLEGLRDIFDTLALVFDHNDCRRLRILCDTFPCLPRSIEPDAPTTVVVDTRMRYLSKPHDLRLVLGYLENLALQ